MIYSAAVFKPLGDHYLGVQFGDEANMLLSFRVLQLDLELKKTQLWKNAIRETIPTTRSLGLIYDPSSIARTELVSEIRKLESNLTPITERILLPSRILNVPIWYRDPWTIECAKAHLECWDHGAFGGCNDNVEYVARLNGVTVEEFIQQHSSYVYWTAWVGFTPGVFVAYSLDPRAKLSAPKYKTVRSWSPPNSISMAGFCVLSNYTTRSPGGYQLLGITPWNFYEPQQRNSIFKHNPVLIKVGDRCRIRRIEESEYHSIRKKVEEGTCDYESNMEDSTYDTNEYLTLLRELHYPFETGYMK